MICPVELAHEMSALTSFWEVAEPRLVLGVFAVRTISLFQSTFAVCVMVSRQAAVLRGSTGAQTCIPHREARTYG